MYLSVGENNAKMLQEKKIIKAENLADFFKYWLAIIERFFSFFHKHIVIRIQLYFEVKRKI